MNINPDFNWTGLSNWRCDTCINSTETECKECGHKRCKCSMLGIDVENDFYCAKWKARFDVQVPRGLPDAAPCTDPFGPIYRPTWVHTDDNTGNITYTKNEDSK